MKQISLNFGAIKDTIFRYAGKELMSEGKNSTTLSSFLASIKDEPALKIQYLIFKNLEEGIFKKERLAERYLNQNLKILESLTWDKVIDINRDIRIKLLENAHVEGAEGKGELYESIHTLIESTIRKGYTNIEKSEAAYEFVLNNLLREQKEDEVKPLEENDGPSFLSWDFVTKMAVNNFNKRYAHLNEEDKSLLKILLSTEDNKINYLEELKNENLELINGLLMEGVSKDDEILLNSFKSKLEGVSKQNLDEAIINCAELKESLVEASKN